MRDVGQCKVRDEMGWITGIRVGLDVVRVCD